MDIAILNIAIQSMLLFYIWRISAARSKSVLYIYFNPFTFFILFYFLFFMLEQVIYLSNDYLMIGFERFGREAREEAYGRTQFVLIGFLMSIIIGQLLGQTFGRREEEGNRVIMFEGAESSRTKYLVYVFFVAGLSSVIVLGIRFLSITGFRSELVKSADGLLLTAISFFGIYAYSYMMFSFMRDKKYLMVAVITVLFGGAMVFIGARGRFLWPFVLSFVLYFGWKDEKPRAKLLINAIGVLLILSIMDPLRKVLIGEDDFSSAVGFDLSGTLGSLLIKRNFDGFANFSLIYNTTYIEPHVSRILTGTREVFMNTFFPEVYASGVAFGSTLPGYFYMSGGTIGVLVFGAIYGFALSVLNALYRTTESLYVCLSYLFLMTWVCAVGGDYVESVDKIINAVAPGFVLAAFRGHFFGARRKRASREWLRGQSSIGRELLGK